MSGALASSVPATVRMLLRRAGIGGVAYVVIVEILLQLVFGRVAVLDIGFGDGAIPRGVIVLGAVVGSLYGLVAFGVILVWRAAKIINFAQAGFGAAAAVLGLVLVTRRGWPFFLALAVAGLAAAALGATVERVVIRRFRTAPRLILSVATIGVALGLAFVEFYVPRWVSGGFVQNLSLDSPLVELGFDIGFVRIDGDALLGVAVVLVVLGALSAFFRFSDVGIAIRASAENADRTALLGIPVARLSTIVWIVAAVLSALSVFLRATLVGLPIGTLVGPSVLLYGLAAAVMAGMSNLSRALLAGMALGVLEQATVFATRDGSLASAVLLVVLLVALMSMRGTRSRALHMGVSTFSMVEDVRPIPLVLRTLPEVRWARRAALAVGAAVALAGPWLVADSQRGLETRLVIFAMIGVSLVILTGWTGQISLGQFGFAAVGAAVAGCLATRYEADFFLTLLLAGIAGAVAAVLIGWPTARFGGPLLAASTLAFAFTAENVIVNRRFSSWLLPEEGAFVERPLLYGFWSSRSDTRFYYVSLAALAVTVAFALALRRYRGGRVLQAVRDNERTAEALGVTVLRTRLVAFAISGFIAAVAGALLAFYRGSVEQSGFSPQVSIDLFVMTVIGGVSSVFGAILGALYVFGMPLLPGLSHIDQVDLLTTSIGVVYLLMYVPGGLSEVAVRIRDTYLRWVASRHGLRVPSLIADAAVEPAAGTEVTAPLMDPSASTAASTTAEAKADRPPEPEGMPYASYLRAEGIGLAAVGAAWAVAAWPGLLLDYPRPGVGLFPVPVAVVGVAVVAWRRHSARLDRPGEWFTAASTARASAFRDVASATLVRRAVARRSLVWGASGVAWIGFSAWRHLEHDQAMAVWTFGPGLAGVALGVLLATAGADVARRLADSSGEKLVVAAPGGLAGKGARLAVRGGAADVRRDAERASGALLSCRDVRVAYGQVEVLFGCDVAVRPAEIVALLGTNGAGKSTLLRAASGLSTAHAGVVLLDGRDITHMEPADIARAGVIQVPGGRAVFPTLTVAEHLRLAGWMRRHGQTRLDGERDAPVEPLQHFPELADRGDSLAGDLSGGEQQMLAMAMSLLCRPRVLLVDELSLGLAPAVVEKLLGAVRALRDHGVTVVLVEQSLNVALTIADRAYFMEKGEVRFEGPSSELLERGDIVRSVFLVGATPARSQAQPIVERATPTRDGVALRLESLSCHFGGVTAVRDVSFSVSSGEIIGLIGPNGAGKTTLLDIVSGFTRPDTGSVQLGAEDVTSLPPVDRSRRGLTRSFQDARLVPSLTVVENLALAFDRHLPLRDLVAGGFALPLVVEQEYDIAWSVQDLVELMNLGDYRDKLVRDLSTGSRRMVDLAMAMAHDPVVLLLDEPAAGIAQREAEALTPVLRGIRDTTGCSLVVVEHDMPLIREMSDRLVALEAGRVVAIGAPDQVLDDPAVIAAYLGTDAAAINRSGLSAHRRETRRRSALRAASR